MTGDEYAALKKSRPSAERLHLIRYLVTKSAPVAIVPVSMAQDLLVELKLLQHEAEAADEGWAKALERAEAAEARIAALEAQRGVTP